MRRILLSLVITAGLALAAPGCGGSASHQSTTTTPADHGTTGGSGAATGAAADAGTGSSSDQGSGPGVSTDDDPCPDQPPCGG